MKLKASTTYEATSKTDGRAARQGERWQALADLAVDIAGGPEDEYSHADRARDMAREDAWERRRRLSGERLARARAVGEKYDGIAQELAERVMPGPRSNGQVRRVESTPVEVADGQTTHVVVEDLTKARYGDDTDPETPGISVYTVGPGIGKYNATLKFYRRAVTGPTTFEEVPGALHPNGVFEARPDYQRPEPGAFPVLDEAGLATLEEHLAVAAWPQQR